MKLKKNIISILSLGSLMSIGVVSCGHTHTVVVDKGVEATCVSTGLTEGSHCSECKQVLKAQEVIEKKEHTVVVDEGIEPTCYSFGMSNGSHCSECNQVLELQTKLDKVDHTVVEDKEVSPTCTSVGKTSGTHCEKCGVVLEEQQLIHKTNHNSTLFNYGTKNEVLVCNDCKNIGLPQINIEVNNDITTDYSDCKVSVNANNEEYDFDSKEASIKVRGNATATYSKKPYRIKFDKKQSMLGLNSSSKAKNWVLLAEYQDRTHFKNMSSFYMAKNIFENNYCSDYKFVDVYINGDYNGVYLLSEQQEVGENRININKCKEKYEGTDIGYFLEMDSYYWKEENYFSLQFNDLDLIDGEKTTDENYCKQYVIKSDIYSDNQKAFIQKVTQNIWNILYDAIYNDHEDISTNPYKTLDDNYEIVNDSSILDCKSAVEKVVDLDSILELYLLNEIIQNNDVGWSSFYFTFDASKNGDKKLKMTAPWDSDGAFGMSVEGNYLLTAKNRNSTWHHLVNPWFTVFAKTDWFLKEAANKWGERKCNDIVNELISDLDVKYLLFSNDFNLNEIKWYGENYSKSRLEKFKNYLSNRTNFLNEYFSNITKETK